MRRDCFEVILSNFYVASNDNLNQTDRNGKLRPTITALNEKCMRYAPDFTVLTNQCVLLLEDIN